MFGVGRARSPGETPGDGIYRHPAGNTYTKSLIDGNQEPRKGVRSPFFPRSLASHLMQSQQIGESPWTTKQKYPI